MSRIRSLHPGVHTDEAWASISIAARWFAAALMQEADDHGIFEWKPLQLKMRIFPADTISVPELLAELEAAGIIRQFTHKGKAYGAIRNFGKYQRPRRPKYAYPLPDELRAFVAADYRGKVAEPGDEHGAVRTVSEQGGAKEPSVPTTSGEAAQMEDGGWRMEDGEEKNSDANASSSSSSKRASAPAAAPKRDPDFSGFYEAFPRKVGIDDAEDEYVRAVEKGADPAFLLEAVKDYARRHVGDDAKFVTTPAKWLRDRRWTEYKPPTVPPRTEATVEIRTDDPRWRALKDRYVSERKRNPPTVSGSWHFPASWVAELKHPEAA
jgi:hypothetical protein